jgi:hypothetical protein
VGPDGEVVCTDGDPENASLAEKYLSTAGMWDRVRYRVGDALSGFAQEAGDFDKACYFGDGQWGLAGATEPASTALGHPRACRQDPAWTVPTERALTTSRTNEVRDCRSGTPTTRRLAVDITSVVDMDDVNPISIFVDLVDDTVATTSGGA